MTKKHMTRKVTSPKTSGNKTKRNTQEILEQLGYEKYGHMTRGRLVGIWKELCIDPIIDTVNVSSGHLHSQLIMELIQVTDEQWVHGSSHTTPISLMGGPGSTSIYIMLPTTDTAVDLYISEPSIVSPEDPESSPKVQHIERELEGYRGKMGLPSEEKEEFSCPTRKWLQWGRPGTVHENWKYVRLKTHGDEVLFNI